MKRKKWAILGMLALLAGMLAGVLPAGAAPPPPDYRPEDVGPELREWEATESRIRDDFSGLTADEIDALEAEALEAAAGTPYGECVLDAKFWLYLDDYNGYYDFAVFYLIAESPGSELWVQEDLSWPEGDPRATPVITCEQVEYMIDQFDTNIYPKEVDFFGSPDFHDGNASVLEALGYVPPGYYDDDLGRQVILVENVRDENYYDSTYPLYIAGFFSPSLEAYFDRNTMTIDAYDWEHRTGPNPPDDPPSNPARPYLYEGVFAHEYQHLLHSDYDPIEENWINEGLSDWAEWLAGYGIPDSHVEAASTNPENSLVAWGDQGDLELLTDYGIAYLFQEYMYKNFGEDFTKAEFLSTEQGITSVDSLLAGESSFADEFHNFSAALYTSGAFSLEELNEFQVDVGHPGKRNPEAYATEGAPPWGTDYYLLWGFESIKNFQFNGFQFNPTEWTSDGGSLWGGEGDLIDNFLVAAADLSGITGATLTFDTMFDIEFAWDYGFVQVSTNGGSTWTSLSNADTCSDLASGAHPKVVANVPGFTGVSGFGCNDPYEPDEYPSADWISTSFDLSAFDDQEILVAFRYVTDWAYNEPGWYVKNVDIAGVFTADGSTTDPFQSLNEVLGVENQFTVTFIGERNRKGESEFEVQEILSGDYVSEWVELAGMFDNYRSIVMLVTYDAPEGVTSYASYEFDLINGGGKGYKNK